MAGMREELKTMAEGFRWGRRPLVPRSAEPFAPEKEDSTFPTAWARTEAGTAARQLDPAERDGPVAAEPGGPARSTASNTSRAWRAR